MYVRYPTRFTNWSGGGERISADLCGRRNLGGGVGRNPRMEKQDRNSDSAPELVTAQECKPSTAAAANCGCQPPTFWNSASVSAARHTSAAAALCGQPGRHEPHPNPSVHEPSLTELTWELLLWRDHLESLSTLQMPCPPPAHYSSPTTARLVLSRAGKYSGLPKFVFRVLFWGIRDIPDVRRLSTKNDSENSRALSKA